MGQNFIIGWMLEYHCDKVYGFYDVIKTLNSRKFIKIEIENFSPPYIICICLRCPEKMSHIFGRVLCADSLPFSALLGKSSENAWNMSFPDIEYV